jgi:hypothetical protein
MLRVWCLHGACTSVLEDGREASKFLSMGKALSKPVCVTAGVCYPAYASFKALETPSPHDDKQWLTYWAVYGICTSAETISSRFLNWVPGYYLVKMLVLVWMMLPRTKVQSGYHTKATGPADSVGVCHRAH